MTWTMVKVILHGIYIFSEPLPELCLIMAAFLAPIMGRYGFRHASIWIGGYLLVIIIVIFRQSFKKRK